MIKGLNVFWSARKVGRLWLDERRNFIFHYDPAWTTSRDALPISLKLPLRVEAYRGNLSKPFFSNLLPEAQIREMIAKGFGVSETNDFKLLEELGGECAGALSLLPDGRSPDEEGYYQAITPDELDKMIEEMPRRPLLRAKEGLRLSLAGAQNKLPVYVKDGAIFLPRGGFSSSHILKANTFNLKDAVENEAFCMMLASECELPVPKVTIFKGASKTLLVPRYDRVPDGTMLRRVHQEDFCQALGYSSEQKYQDEGGPSLKACFALLQEHSNEPITDKRHVLRWVVFNYLIGNCDAHAKNLSLLIARDGVRLAPFYDIMSTRVYPALSGKLAMKIGGENLPEAVEKRHWDLLATEAGVGVKAVARTVEDLAKQVPAAARRLAATFVPTYGGAETIRKIERIIEELASRLQRSRNSDSSVKVRTNSVTKV